MGEKGDTLRRVLYTDAVGLRYCQSGRVSTEGAVCVMRDSRRWALVSECVEGDFLG